MFGISWAFERPDDTVARATPDFDLSEFELAEGMIYAFFDHGCGVGATLFQQT